MGRFKICLLVFFLLYFNTETFSQNVRVIFVNKTNKTIDSLVANGVFIGQIKPDSLSKVVTYEYLTSDSSMGEIRGTGLLDKQRVKSWPDFGFCGTGPYHTVEEGDFLYYINYRYVNSCEYIVFDTEQ